MIYCHNVLESDLVSVRALLWHSVYFYRAFQHVLIVSVFYPARGRVTSIKKTWLFRYKSVQIGCRQGQIFVHYVNIIYCHDVVESDLVSVCALLSHSVYFYRVFRLVLIILIFQLSGQLVANLEKPSFFEWSCEKLWKTTAFPLR